MVSRALLLFTFCIILSKTENIVRSTLFASMPDKNQIKQSKIRKVLLCYTMDYALDVQMDASSKYYSICT